MVKVLSMVKLRTSLSGVVEQLRNDEPVVVTHYNRAIVVILPLAEYERITGQVFRYALSETYPEGAGFERVDSAGG